MTKRCLLSISLNYTTSDKINDSFWQTDQSHSKIDTINLSDPLRKSRHQNPNYETSLQLRKILQSHLSSWFSQSVHSKRQIWLKRKNSEHIQKGEQADGDIKHPTTNTETQIDDQLCYEYVWNKNHDSLNRLCIKIRYWLPHMHAGNKA